MTDKAKSKNHKPSWLSRQFITYEIYPLSDAERDKVRWAETPAKGQKTLKRMSIRIVGLIVAITVLSLSISTFYGRDSQYIAHYNGLVMIALLSLTYFMVTLDLFAINTELTDNRRKYKKHEDTTNTKQRQIAFRKLRVARMLVVHLSIRIGLIISTSAVWLFSELSYFTETGRLSFDASIIPLALGLIVISAGFILIEPIWRVEAMSAIGVALSSHIKNRLTVLVLGIVILVVVSAIQIVYLYGLNVVLLVILSPLLSYARVPDTVLTTVLILLVSGNYFLFWLFYKAITKASHERIR